jgi:RNA polymerase sigma-70 factor, ECF subfamily
VDAEAELTRLFRTDYARLVQSLALAFDVHDAADAVQDAYVAAYRRWTKLTEYDDPAAWIRRVAVNRLLNEQRNRRRRSAVLQTLRPAEPDGQTDRLTDLGEALAGLPLQMRLTVSLFYLEELTGQEIADLLGVSPGTVRSNLHDARQRLRIDLQEEAYERHP